MFHRFLELIAPHLPENNRLERIWKLAQVDFKRRYYNDRLGLLWALINPLFQVTIYYLVFKYAFNSPTENLALFIFSGILTWMFFSESTNKSLVLLKSKMYLIENIQFNWIDLFTSHVLSVFFALLFNLTAFVFIVTLFGNSYSVQFFYLPIVLLTLLILCLAVSMILATLEPFLKDIAHLWDMVLLVGFWMSGIFFEASLITNKLPVVLYLNPFIGIIHNVRGCILEGIEVNLSWLLYDLIYAIIVLAIAFVIFNRHSTKAMEKI